MNDRWLPINQLDRELIAWKKVNKEFARPRLGWLKTIRMALSMSARQLGDKLGISQSGIAQLEHAEVHGNVTLRSLKETAQAMNCEFVYAIVPKGELTLRKILDCKAEELAAETINEVAHTMSLENQTISPQKLKKQKALLIKYISNNFNRKYWDVGTDKKQKPKNDK